MKKFIWLLIFLTLIFIVGCSHVNEPTTDKDVSSKFPAPGFEGVPEAIVVDSNQETGIKEFDIVAKQWDFQPSIIKVNKGDKVKLNIKSIDIKHGFALTDFGINKDLNVGETTIVEFTADKSGTFSFFCSVYCGSGHKDMKGILVVNE